MCLLQVVYDPWTGAGPISDQEAQDHSRVCDLFPSPSPPLIPD